jgi:hypothetical protein
METENDKHGGRGSRQRSSLEQSAQIGNHAEETQNAKLHPVSPNIGMRSETRNKYNKRIQWIREEMTEVAWCFLYIEEPPVSAEWRGLPWAEEEKYQGKENL